MNVFDPLKYQEFLDNIPDYNRDDSSTSNSDYSEAIGKIIRRALIKNKAIIAGGSVVKVYSDIPNEQWGESDIDIYVHQKHAVELITSLKNICEFSRTHSFAASAYCQSFFKKNKILVRLAGTLGRNTSVDIMVVDNSRPLNSVVSNFDLTFCEIWYDGIKINASNANHVTAKHGFLRKEYQDALFKESNHFIKSRIQKYSKRGFIIEVAKSKQPIRLQFIKNHARIYASDEERLVKFIIKRLLTYNDNYTDDYFGEYRFELMKFLCEFKHFTVSELNNSIIKHVSKDIFMKKYRMYNTTQIISPKAIYAFIVRKIYKTEYIEDVYKDDMEKLLDVYSTNIRNLTNNGTIEFFYENMITFKPQKQKQELTINPLTNDRLDILYSNYNLLIDKTNMKVKTLMEHKGVKAFIALSKDLMKLKSMHVLEAPKYNRIRKININDSDIDHTDTYIKNKIDNLPMIAVTPEFIKWFELIINKLKKTVNKNTTVDLISQLPQDIRTKITDQLPYRSYTALKTTSTTLYNDLSLEKRPYFASNHSNFIKAFSSILHKYRTTETEAEILENYRIYLDEYTKPPEFEYIDETDEETNNEINEDYNNHYRNAVDANAKMIKQILIMYIKLLNASNMNPKYVFDLITAYKNKHDIPFIGKHLSNKQYEIELIIKHELCKVYLVMYLINENDTRIDNRSVRMCVKEIIDPNSENIMKYDMITELYIEYIINYIISLNINRPSEIDWNIEYNFKQLKKNFDKTIKISNDVIIQFPSEFKTIINLRTHPIGIENYQKCANYIMKNKNAITKYNKKGLSFNLAFF